MLRPNIIRLPSSNINSTKRRQRLIESTSANCAPSIVHQSIMHHAKLSLQLRYCTRVALQSLRGNYKILKREHARKARAYKMAPTHIQKKKLDIFVIHAHGTTM